MLHETGQQSNAVGWLFLHSMLCKSTHNLSEFEDHAVQRHLFPMNQ